METPGDAADRHAGNLFGLLTSPLVAGLIVFLGTAWWTCEGFVSSADNGWRLSAVDPALLGSGGVIGGAPSCERVIPMVGDDASAWLVALLVAGLGYVVVFIALVLRNGGRRAA
ncbi:hypothetical protein AVP42_02518 [Agromyces sp. NDB4Y10]|uniref:hypothetical protein n=1 Tax=Agromyces sp. NDB4Y10 TaxID=1775951 RepID=UPI0007B20D33|nr:hypothetical protein [Agromyces sp. NDB4Y10]KZE92365.1 hypothetical protein AVP42_02518 [Agromyces sp. NDB4Y10]